MIKTLLLALALAVGATPALAGKRPPYEHYLTGSAVNVTLPMPAAALRSRRWSC